MIGDTSYPTFMNSPCKNLQFAWLSFCRIHIFASLKIKIGDKIVVFPQCPSALLHSVLPYSGAVYFALLFNTLQFCNILPSIGVLSLAINSPTFYRLVIQFSNNHTFIRLRVSDTKITIKHSFFLLIPHFSDISHFIYKSNTNIRFFVCLFIFHQSLNPIVCSSSTLDYSSIPLLLSLCLTLSHRYHFFLYLL